VKVIKILGSTSSKEIYFIVISKFIFPTQRPYLLKGSTFSSIFSGKIIIFDFVGVHFQSFSFNLQEQKIC